MRYVVDASRVSHERLGDEVIVINVASGAYYSGSGTFADLWSLLAAGASLDELVPLLAEAYGADPGLVLAEVEECVGALLAKGVVERGEAAGSGPPRLPEGVRQAWSRPTFDEYTDMWDLIQLDPIHDVGEAGWPFAAPKSES